ncbi:hypothetical protein R6Q59_002924 [Mikania micrantha]
MRRLYCLVFGCMMLVWGACGDESLAQQCSEKLPEVMTCTAFASGKESSPEAKCCDSVKEMKESNPACLCFLIQQIHNGTNPMLQKMNIQEARLLQLPSACKIANATISDCPKLLKLPPNSPDAKIFSNVTNTVSPPTSGSGGASTPSHGFKHAIVSISIILYGLLFLHLLIN